MQFNSSDIQEECETEKATQTSCNILLHLRSLHHEYSDRCVHVLDTCGYGAMAAMEEVCTALTFVKFITLLIPP
jgi:hypothetical protein